jgi:hypothetical protein
MFAIARRNSSRSSALSIASRIGADHLDAESLEHALVAELQRAVQRGLAAERRQQGVGRSFGR